MLHRRPTCLHSLIEISTCLNILIFIYYLLIYIYWNNILGFVVFRLVSDEAYVKVSDQAGWSLKGLQWVLAYNNIFVN